jgi:ribosomal protein S18 acetylase RimI-like enzyme
MLQQIEVRNFEEKDRSLLGSFHQSVTADKDTVFWWIGPEGNWINVYCAFENGRMVAKGQVAVVSKAEVDSTAVDRTHKIYVNLKVVPDREKDTVLYNLVYDKLVHRALELRDPLPSEYRTMICVGNVSTEEPNNAFFINQGYKYLKSLYSMSRDFEEPIDPMTLKAPYRFMLWDMPTSDDVQEYMEIDAEIWPDARIQRERLINYRQKPIWTTLTVREQNRLIGSTMVWKREQDGAGQIEDVLVREPWRKQGIAKYMLTQALFYLKDQNCTVAELQVEAANESALQLYRGLGFEIDSEEVRYGMVLDHSSI